MKLSGRTILITGGSDGIGLAFAAKFADLGNTVSEGPPSPIAHDTKRCRPGCTSRRIGEAPADRLSRARRADEQCRDQSVSESDRVRFERLDGGNVSSALAFVPLPCIPIYCATKAAIHSYTQSLRFQLEDSGVEVIELMPPAVRTQMTAALPEEMKLISTEELVNLSLEALRRGVLEVRPGQTAQLAFMPRLAPDFIHRQLWKAARALVPQI